LARDGIGIKPLYYAETDHAVLFASEIKGLLAGSRLNAFRLDPEALHTFLAAGHAGTRRSLIKGVAQVGPGSVMAFTSEHREAWTFWTPRRAPEIVDLDQALGLCARTLEDVVASQLVSDVPLGILQSGGIDSTLISLAVGRTGARPPVFTGSFKERSHDETEFAHAVAGAAGLPHCVVPMDSAGDQVALLRAVVHHFDGQCADTGALAFYKLSQAVRRHSTVALSGDGGDEFFGGYETYAATQVAATLRHVLPRRLARNIGHIAYHCGARAEGRLPLRARVARFGLGFGESERVHLEWRRLVPAFLTHRVYGPEMFQFLGQSPYGEYALYYDTADGSLLDRAMLADQRFHLQSILAKVDAMSMAHGLEIRVPLLDRRVMELAGRIDLRLLHPGLGPPKHLLRALARRLGAPEKVTRAPKKGFNVPIARLLRRELRLLGDDVLDRQADVLYPYLSPDGVRALWREHREYRSDHAFALWPILTLAIWQAGLARASTEATRVGCPQGHRSLRHAVS
jgi:asparagine synthase (glutamine-hydrolysing)